MWLKFTVQFSNLKLVLKFGVNFKVAFSNLKSQVCWSRGQFKHFGWSDSGASIRCYERFTALYGCRPDKNHDSRRTADGKLDEILKLQIDSKPSLKPWITYCFLAQNFFWQVISTIFISFLLVCPIYFLAKFVGTIIWIYTLCRVDIRPNRCSIENAIDDKIKSFFLTILLPTHCNALLTVIQDHFLTRGRHYLIFCQLSK